MSNKEEIMDAAFYMFAAKGYDLTMRALADLTHLKVQSLYSHFAAKDEIITAIIQKEIESYSSFFRREVKPSIQNYILAEDRLKELFLSNFKYFNSSQKLKFWRNIALIENEELKKKFSAELAVIDQLHMATISEIIHYGIEQGEITDLNCEGSLSLYLCMVQGILDAMLLFSTDGTELIQNTWEAYWRGIKK